MSGANYNADLVDKLVRYEQGEMDSDETVEFFQHLVDTGLAWTLQGSYGRTAQSMINRGVIVAPTNGYRGGSIRSAE